MKSSFNNSKQFDTMSISNKIRESYWDTVVSDEVEPAKEIVPAAALSQAIEKRLYQRVKRLVELGAFMPGKMSSTSADFLLVRTPDDNIHILFNELGFEFNGKDRVLLTVPVVLQMMERQDGVYKVVDMNIDNNWRNVFMISNPGRQKGMLPGKNVEGHDVMKVLSPDSLKSIISHVADQICGNIQYVPKGDEVVSESRKMALKRIIVNEIKKAINKQG